MPSLKREKCYVNGKFIPAKNHKPVLNPYTGETIALMPIADEAMLDRAMEAASRAFKPFAKLARDERASMLHAVEQGIAQNAESFAKIISYEAGKPIKLARGEVERSCVTCKHAAEEAVRFGGEWLPLDISPASRNFTALVGRVPIGPTLGISPCNFPLNLAMHKLAPAIAAGCPVIIKPSSETPLSAIWLAKSCHYAELPAGAVQVVPCSGNSFEKLVTDDRAKMLSFTGSAEVGWKLKELAGRKRVALELGGNAAVVVHEDADLQFAAKRIAFGGFAHAGQVCISVQRVFVHEPVYHEFVNLLIKESKLVKSGDPMDEDVIAGPMITGSEADRVESWIDEAIKMGAKYLLKGKRTGNVLTPTILADVSHKAKVYSSEVFGPVVVVEPYTNWDDALKLVNDSIYGLQAGIFTNDINRIMHAYVEIEAGAVIANDIPTVRVDNYPYGGVKESGTGREGVRCTMNEMTEERVLVIRL